MHLEAQHYTLVCLLFQAHQNVDLASVGELQRITGLVD